MPRTRRTPASDPLAQDAAQVETPPVTSDTSFTSDPPAAEPVKTPRRRAPRPPKAEPQATDAAPAAEVPDAAPKRQRGRRAAAAEPAAAPEIATAAPLPDAAPPRRRGRRTATPEATAPDTAAAESPTEAAAPETVVKAPTRRRGQARQVTPEPVSIAEETPELPDIEAPVIEAETITEAPPTESASKRRRGRRRGSSAPAALPETDLPDAEAPVVELDSSDEADEEAETEAAPDDTAKQSKRSRRGRRRRGGLEEVTTEMLEAAGSTLLLPDEIAEIEAPEDDDDASLVYPPPAAPTYTAPLLVARALPPADNLSVPRVSASLAVQTRGLSKIRVNTQDHAPYFFFVNTETARDGETVEAQIRDAAANGIHLFSGVMYLPLRNAYGDRSFGAIDALISQVLTADPDGFILPRLQFVPTNYWARTHTDQLAKYSNGEEGDVSLASTEFWADCVDALDALIAHFNDPSTPGGDRVIGFHLDRGEWFYDSLSGYDLSLPNQTAFQNWLHAKYQNLYALRAAWHDADVTFEDAAIPAWPGMTATLKKTDTPLYFTRREGRWPDYAQFSSEIVAEIIGGLAAAIKTLSQGNLLVAASYGYTLEFAGRSDSGHLALGKLLKSPHLDIVAGPNSYAGRGVGNPAAFGAPLDSVTLHRKLWLVEDDTKTFLADAETDDTYNPKIASGADTQAIHQRHFGAALAHRAGVTWMDLWGQGWLNNPDIWRELGGLSKESSRWEQLVPTPPPAPDVVVLVDETSLAYLKTDPNGLGTHLVSRTRDLLLRAGGSVGFYLQSDVTQPSFPDAKLYLFLNALRLTTEERAAIREKLQKPGKTLAWLYAPGVFDENGPSSEEAGEVVGMALRPQPWNSRGGSQATDIKHPITDRIRGVKKIGTEEILNPLYAVSDPQATVIAEYTVTGAASLAVREHKAGWKSVFFGDPYLTTELLRGLYAYANIPVYDGQDDSVYAGSDGSLTIHGSFTGQRTISLPRKASVYDVFDNKIIATNARSFRAFVRARTTRLYLWGDGDILARTTGLDLPAQSAEAEPAPTVSTPPPLTPREPRPELTSDIPGLEPELVVQTVTALETLEATLTETSVDLDADQFTDEPSDDASETEEVDSAGAPLRRSRWQRRRAATRARRDAERAAKLTETASDGSLPTPAPVDFATLMPGLPPRRTPPPASARVADIVAADIADDEAFRLTESTFSESAFSETTLSETTISDTAALGFSDAALTDMSDDFTAVEEEAESE
ncbi:MAG: hypothetical protein ACRYFS_11790 [Janthinobacterium lividum]